MKRIIMILALGLALAGVSFGQKKISQRCPGSNSSAEVSISKKGDVAITKCTGRTLTIDGSVFNVSRPAYYAQLQFSGVGVPPIAYETGDSLGVAITWAWSATGTFVGTLDSSAIPSRSKVVLMASSAYDSATLIIPVLVWTSSSSVTLYTFDAGGNLVDPIISSSRKLHVGIIVYP